MYSSSLDHWYKKREIDEQNDVKYTSKQLKFGMRTYLFLGMFLGIFMGYLIWA